MKKLIIAVLVFLSAASVYAQKEAKHEQLIGMSMNMHVVNFSGEALDDIDLVNEGIGFSYGAIHKDVGLSSVFVVSLPIVNMLYGVILSGSSLSVDNFIGYGKSFHYAPPLMNPDRLKVMLNLSGGLHTTVLGVFYSNEVLQVYSAGPAINYYIGWENQRFRVNMTLWFDPAVYGVSSDEDFIGWKKYQTGLSAIFGICL